MGGECLHIKIPPKIRRTLFRPRTVYTGILYLVIVLDFDLYSPGLHCLCCVILQCSSVEKKNWRRGECVKELVELMKLQKKGEETEQAQST